MSNDKSNKMETAGASALDGRSGIAAKPFDVAAVRAQFPVLHQNVHGQPLAYLDNAATSQKPAVVIDAVRTYYEKDNANIHRAVHTLSERATSLYEGARRSIQKAIGASSSKEVIFTRGTTESINLIAASYGRSVLSEGDEVVISTMEHHSNIVPWFMLCEEKGARLRVVPIDDKGDLDLDAFAGMLGPRTKIVSMCHISNTLGTINPLKEIIRLAREHNVCVVVDGAQGIPHVKINVNELDCDFYAFSSHKAYGPTGTGVLYGKQHILEKMPPYQGGGDMIASVSFDKITYADVPAKFEAGTPNIAGSIGLAAALDFLEQLDYGVFPDYEDELLAYAHDQLQQLDGLRIIGQAKEKTSVISFIIDRIHPHDIGTMLDNEGVAVRTGHHCTQPLMERFNVPATTRASFSFYNTREEVDQLVAGLKKIMKVFR